MNSRGSGGWALLGLKVGRTKGKTGGAGLLTRPIQAKVVAHRTTRNSCSQSSPLAKAEHTSAASVQPTRQAPHRNRKAVQSRRNPEAHQLTQVYRSCRNLTGSSSVSFSLWSHHKRSSALQGKANHAKSTMTSEAEQGNPKLQLPLSVRS